jgi:hypothetical protein
MGASEWTKIAQDNETGLNRRLAQVTGHEVGCECKPCAKTRKTEMTPVWERKWASEDAEEKREKMAEAAGRRPAEKLQEVLDRREEVKDARRGLRARRAAAVHEAARLGRKPSRTAEESRRMEAAGVTAADLHVAERTFRKQQKALTRSANQLRAVTEARVYGEASPYSWYMDVANSKDAEAPGHAAATERLRRYSAELSHEARRGSPEGQRCERLVAEDCRTDREDVHEKTATRRIDELRAFGTGGGATASAGAGEASAFVSPAFLLDQWAPYRGVGRPFTENCAKTPLPPYGMHVYLPYLSEGAKATEQTELGSVTETAPVGAFESSEVKTVTGQVTMSQQLHDRALAGGGAVDVVISKQIHEQWEERTEKTTLSAVYATGKSVSGQSSYTTKNLYLDLATARDEITDTAGVRLRPTHLFTTSDLYAWATRQLDNQERPIVVPTYSAGFPLVRGADDFDSGPDPKWARFTGTVLPGGILWFTADAIETEGTTTKTRLIVSAPEVSIVVAESEPVTTIFPQTLGNTMRVIVNLKSYTATLTRHAGGSAIIVGGAYTSGLK